MKRNHEEKFWNDINIAGKNIEKLMDPLERKRTGSYYTDLSLTDVMMEELVNQLRKGSKELVEYSFLEPCVGSGNFVFSYIKAINKFKISKEEAKILLNNIFVSDINENALRIYKENLKKISLFYWGLELNDAYFDSHVGKGLLFDISSEPLEYISLEKAFNNDALKSGFDIVVTNPPYKNLKAEKKHYNNDKDFNQDKKKYSKILKQFSNKFLYSTTGILNLYKLFMEEIISKYANEKAYISLLVPSSVLSDKSSKNLRTYILNNTKLYSIRMINEKNSYIDAQQSLSALFLQKGKKSESIRIINDSSSEIIEINIEDILNTHTGNSILAISKKEYEILNILKKFPTIKELDFIDNLRGELDLTINKKYLTKENTEYPLIRGKNIGYYHLNLEHNNNDFVEKQFRQYTKKNRYIDIERIGCHQISNMNKERRITFSYIPSGYILGNSCNFISVSNNIYGIDIYALLGLLNTKIINYFFKLISSNNHINNYEIDCFPIPVDSEELPIISEMVKSYLINNDPSILEEIEKLAIKAYKLDSIGE